MVSKHLILKEPAVVRRQDQDHALLTVQTHAHQQLEFANVAINLKIINLSNK
jgi:hypothetical protein